MLKQVRLCPSGCQYWNKSVLARGGNLLAYCSTLAIYFIDLDTYNITKIIAAHEQTISCLSWSIPNPSLLASVSSDNSLYVWNINHDEPELYMQLTTAVLMMEFNPYKENEILFLHENGDIRILNTITRTITRKANYVGVRPSVMRFHPSAEGRFALGCAEGVALFAEMGHDNVKRLEMPKQPAAAEDVQWDPLSDKYLLVSFKDGSMVLFDAVEAGILQTFDRQGAGIRSIAWNKKSPGEFFTTSDKIAALKVWNVSKASPIDTIKLGNTGIRQISYLHDRASLICSFKSGAVGVFSLIKKKLEFCTESGHAETVFDIKINPQNKNLLATASYDGSVKIWDLRTMKNIETLYSDALEPGQYKIQAKSVLYGVAWGPDTLIAACSAKGDVYLFDYSKPKLLHRFRPTIEAPIFRIDWSPLDPNMLAIGTSDNYLVTIRLDEQRLVKTKMIRHVHTVYGVSWHPTIPNRIATGCQDSRVRVYDLASGNDTCIELRGHDAKVFNIVWNPEFNNLLASSSDDRSVIVWNTTERTIYRRLAGHTQNTRAVAWNSELPWMLISGAWDSKIMIWDIRTGNCLYTAHEHHADIYGICTHPARPFLFISCSRDTSIRFWSLEDYVEKLEIKVLVNQDLSSLVSAQGSLDPNAPFMLCGSGSKAVLQKLASCNEVERYKALLTFFRFRGGEDEFFDILNFLLNKKECNPNDQILPIESICQSKKSRAAELETASGMAFLGSALAKKEDRLIEAAKIHLKLGNIRQYCELMIKLEKWERALAFAPGFCLDYWQNVAERYAQYLGQNEKEETAAVYLACGKVDKAIKFFQKRRDHDDALLVAASKSAGVFGVVPQEGPRNTAEGQHDVSKLQEITSNLAEEFFADCNSILSAASHLSLPDPDGALTKLLRAHEVTYAYVLAKLYLLPQKSILFILAKKAEKSQDWELMMKLLENNLDLKELFAARLPVGYDYKTFGLLNQNDYANKAEDELRTEHLKEAIRYYVVARYAQKACQVAITMFRDYLQQGNDLSELFEMVEYLGYLNLEPVTKEVKAEILAIGALLGAIHSTWRGYSISHILTSTYSNICRHQNLNLPIPFSFGMMLNVLQDIKRIPDQVKEQIPGIISNLGPEDGESLQYIYDGLGKREISQQANNQIKLIGSNLPANNLHANMPVSVFNRRIIQGPSYSMGNFAIGLDEALMWAKVNPFSPMNDGSIINPY
ncbi:unnamed protein product [Blepharisma stoltei]|uniref:Anaphase-promoting complex subunit 4-like WD40 domain-containing protein n=1 Tax=Blepharisma stoltei TaxID=1481888 RepID=A0AAU9IPN9_9CILI|nr:unnamed protein product [Blepharisma stoltei]